MKVCVAQTRCIPGDIETNCSQITSLAEKAKSQGSYMIVFPEMMDTGYEVTAIQAKASPWPGLPFNTASRTAREFEIHIIVGLSEREKDKIYNSLAVFAPDGNLIAKYRKTHLMPIDPVNETLLFKAGKSLEIVQIGDMRWGLMICYDLRFPEICRELISKGAEVLVVCSAWPFPREIHWEILTHARAIENQCYVIGSNRVGTDGPLTFCGSSRVIYPEGMLVETASPKQEQLLFVEIARESVTSLRNQLPFLKDLK